MRKLFNTLFVIIAAMVTFAGCAKEEVNAPANETKTVQFIAESIETKTAFGTPDGTTYPTLWTANDKDVKISLNYASPKDASVTVLDGGESARFVADITDDASGAYVFYALSPAKSYNSFNGNDKYLSAAIPTSQTPLANSVDESAQILYAISDQYDEMPGSVAMNFKHFTAYGILSFVNLNLGEATVQSVAITSSLKFANRWNYMVEQDKFVENSGASTITLNTSTIENLWFACAPVGSMNGQTLTFTINTDKGPLSKEVTLSGDKYKFEAGKIAKMVVDMAGIEFAESVAYDLVTDVAELTAGSEIIIAAKDYGFALSTTQNNNNRAQTAVTKVENTIKDPGSDVQVITIEEGSVDGTIAFNVGTDRYLCAASSSSNYLRTESTLSANSSWMVEISEAGVATVKAQGSYTRNWMRYNSSSKIFACYGSGQGDICIYKLQGTGSAPLPKLDAPTLTVMLNEDETGFDVSWTAVDNAEEYVLSCTGQDDITLSETSYSFVDMSAGEYTLTVTAKADGYRLAKSAETSVTVPYQGGEGETVTEIISGTFTFANNKLTLTTSSGITIVQEKVSGSTAVNRSYNTATTLRVYKGHALKFSGKTITKIELTHTSGYPGNSVSASTGTYVAGTTSSIWTGESDNIVITNVATENKQLRPTKIVVTYIN